MSGPVNGHDPGRQRVVVYRLEYTDGAVEVGLSFVHRTYLKFLAERGGEARFDWRNAKLTDEQAAHLRELMDRFLLVRELVMVGDPPGVVQHRLTDAGRNVAAEVIRAGGP